MATVERLGGNWVIIRSGGMNGLPERNASPAPQVESSPTREFWTGDNWAGQYGFAKQFTTKEEAETYIAKCHRELA